jgi:hypothetical protein
LVLQHQQHLDFGFVQIIMYHLPTKAATAAEVMVTKILDDAITALVAAPAVVVLALPALTQIYLCLVFCMEPVAAAAAAVADSTNVIMAAAAPVQPPAENLDSEIFKLIIHSRESVVVLQGAADSQRHVQLHNLDLL